MVLLIALVLLGSLAIWLARSGSGLLAALVMVLFGIILAGADSPVADLARGVANGLVDGGEVLVTSIGDAMGDK
ncbi:hypothetical protein [Polymorphospora sp. NPDC050346]|uniref:hypothetical protein n=1 Tax=Polymorphospora sp. NPDC050346 TaxID=3155780 RepID=UPI0033C87AA4